MALRSSLWRKFLAISDEKGKNGIDYLNEQLEAFKKKAGATLSAQEQATQLRLETILGTLPKKYNSVPLR